MSNRQTVWIIYFVNDCGDWENAARLSPVRAHKQYFDRGEAYRAYMWLVDVLGKSRCKLCQTEVRKPAGRTR
jgi:hypothetical protein